MGVATLTSSGSETFTSGGDSIVADETMGALVGSTAVLSVLGGSMIGVGSSSMVAWSLIGTPTITKSVDNEETVSPIGVASTGSRGGGTPVSPSSTVQIPSFS